MYIQFTNNIIEPSTKWGYGLGWTYIHVYTPKALLLLITGDFVGRFKTGLWYGVKAPPISLGPAGLKAEPVSPAVGEGKGDNRTLALVTNLGLGLWVPAAEMEHRGEEKPRSGDSRLVKGGLMRDNIIHCQE